MDAAAQVTTVGFAGSPFRSARREKRSKHRTAAKALLLGIVPGPRFVLHPGGVRLVGDDHEEFISAPRLAHLYGIAFRGCLIAGDHYRPWPGDIHFYPRDDGRYDSATGTPGMFARNTLNAAPHTN